MGDCRDDRTAIFRVIALGWDTAMASGAVYASIPLTDANSGLPLSLKSRLARPELLRSIETYLAEVNQTETGDTDIPE